MDHRIGLIAVNGLDAFALADLFPTLPEERFASSHSWAWLRFDPTVVEEERWIAQAEREPLGKARRPFLVIRGEADRSWRISLYSPKQEPLHLAFHHDFYRPPTQPLEDLLDELDATVPEDFQTMKEEVGKGSGTSSTRLKSLDAVKKAQAKRVGAWINARDDFGDGDQARRVLSGKACSPGERLGPFNVLPQFLDTLSLGKAFGTEDSAWQVGPEAGSVGSFDRSRSLYATVPRAELIAGGPIELPVDDLARFWLLPWFCETDSETDLLIVPKAGTRLRLPRTDGSVEVHRRGAQTYIEITWNPPGRRVSTYRELCQAIAAAPAGTTIEFIAGRMPEDDSDDASLQAGDQRYLGSLTDQGTFLLTHSSVAANPADFLAAMEICRQIDQPKPSFVMPSEQDARGVLELARGTDWFVDAGALPRVKGKSVTAASRDEAMTTMMMVFRKRFEAGPWNTIGGQQQDEVSHQEWETAIQEVEKSLAKAFAAPEGGDIILETERAIFRSADWSKMNVGFLDALDTLCGPCEQEDMPPTPTEKLWPIDRAFTNLKFTRLGDVHCNRFGELYLRGYAGPSGDTFAAIAVGTLGQFAFEFVTPLAGGGSLTTSTTPDLKDKPKAGIYKRSFPTLTPAALYQEHRSALAKLTAAHAEAQPIEATTEGFCRALDDYIKREF
ncbi:hypothetical protein V5E97_03440 [Singulisphaera sp. Ch08]|uniref:Uncharacterized protein n=1 Tax=Singulisphaera sp. Ch08 TaxID=3120278 RepID=A0AAU7CJH5_9BACT